MQLPPNDNPLSDSTGTQTAPVPRLRPATHRDGSGALERMAAYKLTRVLPALPPSKIIDLLLWPQTMAEWARAEGISSNLVYNTLSASAMPGGAKRKEGAPLRERLARRLGVPRREIDYLIDADRPVAETVLPPTPPDGWEPPALADAPEGRSGGRAPIAPAAGAAAPGHLTTEDTAPADGQGRLF